MSKGKMLQKTKLFNIIESNFVNNERIFRAKDLHVSASLMLGYINKPEDYVNSLRGVYACALYRYNAEWLFAGSEKEPRYLVKVGRGKYQVNGPLMGDLEYAKEPYMYTRTHTHTHTLNAKEILSDIKTITDDYKKNIEECVYVVIKEYPFGPSIGSKIKGKIPEKFSEYFEKYIPIKRYNILVTITNTYDLAVTAKSENEALAKGAKHFSPSIVSETFQTYEIVK